MNSTTDNGLRSAEKSPLRVLVVPASYFDRDRTVGGGERYALEYARALAGLPDVLVTLALFGLEAGVKMDGQLTVRTFGVSGFDERRAFPLTRPTWKAFADYDVIHMMVFPTPLADLMALATRWRGQKLVLTDVGGGGTCWSGYLQKLHRRLNLNRLADGLALLSHYSAGFYTDWRQPKTVLHGGADLETFRPTASLPEGYALCVGRLLRHKGILEVIQSIGSETPLHVVGRPYDAVYVDDMKRAATGKRVSFFFEADDSELRRQYAGANVVLQASLPSKPGYEDKSELLGLVAIEAMASGKPVIVTRTTSLPELVVDGVTGYIVEPGDAATLRRRIEGMIAQPDLSVQLGRQARAHVEKNLTWSQTARRGLEFYESIGAAPKGRPS
ncbi:MAG TPA: glycosyltransferase family 4 protein [Roseimicrobium sp.]|nr:glycosyltransferase family 4 protein [Roseimicrobium sp.]